MNILKILTLILFSFFLSEIVTAQNTNLAIGYYTWNKAVLLTPSDSEGNEIKGKEITSLANQSFQIIGFTNERKEVVIRFPEYFKITKFKRAKFKKPTSNFWIYNHSNKPSFLKLTKDEKKLKSYGENQKYFIVDVDTVKNYTLLKKLEISSLDYNNFRNAFSLSFGIINFPFKIRPQKNKFDFSGNFNFGAAVGLKYGHRKNINMTTTTLIGYSLSSIRLDSISTKRNGSDLVKINNFSAMSFSLGQMFEIKKVQIGVFAGLDFLNRVNQARYGWDYQSKVWYSIGFGYSLFSNPKSKPSKLKNENSEDGS